MIFFFKVQLENKFESSDLSSIPAEMLEPDQRWMLYKFWCRGLKNRLLVKIAYLQVKHKIS